MISIVTPSYNQAQFLEETILSVLSQDYPSIEYLIIDGGSTDGSVEIIRKYEDRLAYWVSEPDQGQSHAINKGFQRANGEILAWLNSDDLYCPGAVRAAVEFLELHPDVTLVYGRAEMINVEGAAVQMIPWDDFDPATCIARQRYPIPQPAAFFRRDAMQRVGLLDEQLYYWMDWDYWIRIGLAGVKVAKIPRILARCRLHRGSKTVGELIRPQEEMVAWVDRFFSRPQSLEIAAFERQSRSRALLSLGRQHFYAGQYTSARRAVFRGVSLYPRSLAMDRALWLLILSILPGPAITQILRLRQMCFGLPPALEARYGMEGNKRGGPPDGGKERASQGGWHQGSPQ
jgi:glycosyltransferase involved in cell wall biosynthesis